MLEHTQKFFYKLIFVAEGAQTHPRMNPRSFVAIVLVFLIVYAASTHYWTLNKLKLLQKVSLKHLTSSFKMFFIPQFTKTY
jgi:hypothetical protein